MGAVLDLFRQSAKTSPARAAAQTGTSSVALAYDGKVAIPDARMLRHWARNSEWIKGAIGIRKTQVSSAEWDIVPLDNTKEYPRRTQQRLRQLLRTPNPANDSWRSFIEPIIEDLIALDAGCIEKERTVMGDLVALWPVDAPKIKVNALWDGSDPQAPRYFWYPDGWKEGARFTSDDFIYMMQNRRTDSPIGYSPLATLQLTIEAEMQAHEYNRRQVAGAAPDGVLNLGEGMTEQQARQFASYFEAEVAGRGAIGFLAGVKNPGWIPFRANNREMQFLEWQIYLVRKICVVLGLTPQDLGVTYEVNKSTSETQIQISEDRGLRPLMTLIQEYITEEVIWDKSFGGPDNNLAFRFTALNLKESTAKAAIYEKALAGVPWRFVNEARIDEGREPIPEMEGKLIMATPQGAVNIMDVPTVREMLDQQAAAKAKPAPPAQAAVSAPPQPMLGPGAIQITNHQPPVHVESPVSIHEGAFRVDNPVSFAEGAFQNQPVKNITTTNEYPLNVSEYPLTVNEGAIQVSMPAPEPEPTPEPAKLRRTVLRDAEGRVTGVRDELLTSVGVVKASIRQVVRDERGHITAVIEE